MNERVKKLSDQAKALNPDELAELVDDLIVSLHEADPEIEKAWAEEAERRMDAVRRGEVELIDADIVFADIRRKLAEKRAR